MTRISSIPAALAAVLLGFLTVPAWTAAEDTTRVLFTNVHVWDGSSENLKRDHSVLVTDSLIEKVGREISAPKAQPSSTAVGAC